MAQTEQEHTIGTFAHSETDHYVRDNDQGPTGKIVRSDLYATNGSVSTIEDPVHDPIPPGQVRNTHLGTLNLKVTRFHIVWTQVHMGIAHRIDITAPDDRYFRSFAVRWGKHDEVATHYTTAPI
ncbi:MAG: hypothetical protein ABI353_14975 [Isosphaeraceae bacterium]